jgi:ATP-binding protein involved in chromosome partitioning
VIVSTPQDVALADVRKGIAAFQKLSIPVYSLSFATFSPVNAETLLEKIIGLVLNQSYFICPSCNTPHHLFGSFDPPKSLGIKPLGDLPLTPGVSTGGDMGLPYALFYSRSDADGAAGQQWREAMLRIAKQVWESVQCRTQATMT